MRRDAGALETYFVAGRLDETRDDGGLVSGRRILVEAHFVAAKMKKVL